MGLIALKKDKKINEENKFNKIKLFDKKEKNTLLHEFCQKGWVAEVKKIVNKIDLEKRDYYGRTGLDIAKERKHLEIIELIENQIEINGNLFKAIKNQELDEMENLIEQGANLNLRNEDSYMPVHLTVFWKDTRALEKFIELNVDLNVKDVKGWTPLMIAANYGKIEHVKLLLEHNVEINTEDKCGWTALEIVEDRVLNIGLNIQKELDIIIEMLRERKAK